MQLISHLYPQAKIQMNTRLDTNYTLVLHYTKHLPVVEFNDILEVPPEYEPSLKYALAYLLAEKNGKDETIKMGMKKPKK